MSSQQAAKPRRTVSRARTTADRPSIGQLLRERRAYHGWTLSNVSAMTGIAASTLSKIENGVISPTYDKILQLSRGLGIEIEDLLTDRHAVQPAVLARRSIARGFDGLRLETRHYVYTYLCNEVAHKRIIPIHVMINALNEDEMGEMTAQIGEEFVTVLAGRVRLYSEYYEPTDLEVGDSCYLDSTMKHGYISLVPGGSEIMLSCSSATPNLAQTLREIIRLKMLDEAAGSR